MQGLTSGELLLFLIGEGFLLLSTQLGRGFSLLCCLSASCLPPGSMFLFLQCTRFPLLSALLCCRFALLGAPTSGLGALSFFCFAVRFLL
jgi:hypothetical protein